MCFDDFLSLDLTADPYSWQPLPTMPRELHSFGMAASAVTNSVYVLGGTRSLAGQSTDDVAVFRVASNSWTTLADPLPFYRKVSALEVPGFFEASSLNSAAGTST